MKMNLLKIKWLQSSSSLRVSLGDSSSGEDSIVCDSSISFREIHHGRKCLKFLNPLVFDVLFDNSNEVFFVDDQNLELFECGETISELKKLVSDHLVLLWEEFGKVDDELLCESAKLLKQRLRSLIYELPVDRQCQEIKTMSSMLSAIRDFDYPITVTTPIFTT